MAAGHGRVDYLLYVERHVVGVIEAKPEGTTLSGVEWQSAMYATGLPEPHRRRAVTAAYRLLKHGGFTRILFLVDRNNLADQTLAEFGNYRTPDDGRRFTELYTVDKLSSAGMLAGSNVVISTIQRVHRVLSGGEAPDYDDPALDGWTPDAPVSVAHSPALPPETFDLDAGCSPRRWRAGSSAWSWTPVAPWTIGCSARRSAPSPATPSRVPFPRPGSCSATPPPMTTAGCHPWTSPNGSGSGDAVERFCSPAWICWRTPRTSRGRVRFW